MALIRKMAALGSAMAVAAILFGAFTASVSAQQPPFTAYGTGLTAGDTVVAFVEGVECGTTTADAAGQWLLYIEAAGDCAPAAGDIITFTLNGEATTAAEVFAFGGAPADVANGIDLVAVAATPTPEAPGPGATGNAGLLGSTGTSMALVVALGIFAAAMVAGGRTATRRS